jgi:hypothetical protein
LWLLGHFHLLAQEVPANTQEVVGEAPKVKKPREPFVMPLPRGIRAGASVSRLLGSLLQEGTAAYELNGELLLDNRFFLAVDYGFSQLSRTDEDNTFQYKNTGSYFRVGIDYNLLHPRTDDDALFFGVRYAAAVFAQELEYIRSTPVWGEVPRSFEVRGLNTGWIELVAGIRAMVLKNIYLSPTVRFQLGGNFNDGGSGLAVAEVPGFGRANVSSRASYNLSVAYRIQFPKFRN